MKNIKDWEKLINETINKKISYYDSVSIFVETDSGFIVVEDVGRNLQFQSRKTLDHSDIIDKEDVVCNGKMISDLVPSNYDNIKKQFAEFVEKPIQ